MPEHISLIQLQGYRDRTLALGELVAVDTHLGGCEPCRTALAGLAGKTATASVISGIDQARFRHLSYEQMDDWVEDRLDPAGRELVMAHIGACAPCARQLIAYQEYAPKMAAPIRTAAFAVARPVAQKVSFWSFLKQPQYALGAAALLAFFIITPFTRHSSPEQNGAIIAPGSTAVESTVPEGSPLVNTTVVAPNLDSLPDSLRQGVKQLIAEPQNAARPASLKGLEGAADRALLYPSSEVVAEAQPVLRWQAFGTSYNVSLFDSRRSLISRRANLKDTEWKVPSALVRDRIYTWEVESAGQKHRGMFRLLSENQRQELERVRADHGGSHLVMGAVSEQLGLLTPAKQEFEAMSKDRAQAQQAAKMLSRIDGFRK